MKDFLKRGAFLLPALALTVGLWSGARLALAKEGDSSVDCGGATVERHDRRDENTTMTDNQSENDRDFDGDNGVRDTYALDEGDE